MALVTALLPPLEAGSELSGRVGRAAVELAVKEGCPVYVRGSGWTVEESWTEGREAAEHFREEAEAQLPLLEWVVNEVIDYYPRFGSLEGMLEYALSRLERFPRHEKVQDWGCRALTLLYQNSHAIQELAGELGAVEALVHALDRFAASNHGLEYWGVWALRRMTAGHTANAVKLEAAGGTHYLQN